MRRLTARTTGALNGRSRHTARPRHAIGSREISKKPAGSALACTGSSRREFSSNESELQTRDIAGHQVRSNRVTKKPPSRRSLVYRKAVGLTNQRIAKK